MKKKKGIGTILAVMAMGAVSVFPAMASTETIEDVYLTIESEIYAEYNDWDVDVYAETDGCEVYSYDITNEPSKSWKEDDEPKLKIVVEADDGYKFKSSSLWDESDIDIDGDGEVTSVSRNSNTKLTIRVTLPAVEYDDDYYDYNDDLEIWDLEWDDDGTAYWEENDYAKRYEVKLYRDGSLIKDVTKSSDEDYDFSSYFTKKGTYVFKVRGVRSTSEKGRWYESDEWEVSSSEAREIRENSSSSSSSSSSSGSGTSTGGPGANKNTTPGAWLKDSIGWWWCNPDKTYPTSSWKLINGLWYYFNSAGYCVQNSWVQTNGVWYYCGPDGDMWVNRWTPDGYYVNASGAWIQNY